MGGWGGGGGGGESIQLASRFLARALFMLLLCVHFCGGLEISELSASKARLARQPVKGARRKQSLLTGRVATPVHRAPCLAIGPPFKTRYTTGALNITPKETDFNLTPKGDV